MESYHCHMIGILKIPLLIFQITLDYYERRPQHDTLNCKQNHVRHILLVRTRIILILQIIPSCIFNRTWMPDRSCYSKMISTKKHHHWYFKSSEMIIKYVFIHDSYWSTKVNCPKTTTFPIYDVYSRPFFGHHNWDPEPRISQFKLTNHCKEKAGGFGYHPEWKLVPPGVNMGKPIDLV